MEEALSLRNWIKGAMGSIDSNGKGIVGDASLAYMVASLRIAKALAEQISRAEKLAAIGVNSDLDLLPDRAVSDWASCVRFRWKAKVCDGSIAQQHQTISTTNDELLDLQPLPFAPSTNDNISAEGWEDGYDLAMNEQLKTFLSPFDVDRGTPAEAVACDNQDHDPSVSGLHAAADGSNFCYALSSEPENLNYLQIDSAEFWRPETTSCGVSNCHDNTAKEKLHRIFHLGLVYYELFSRGKKPPPDLMTLVASDSAFVSLPLADETDNEVYTSEPKRRLSATTRGSGLEIGACQSSIDYLKIIGLSGRLCDLIFNMLDCIHGDFSGDECYTKIADIVSDLQLMIDKPSKFLRDPDLEKLSSSGLQLNGSLFSRQDEFETIQSCYRRSISGSCEVVIISGESGTGKSWLAHRVGNSLAAQGGTFLSGKFDQMKQAKPFSALASAFDQYCDMLIREKESDWVKLVVCNLQVALGADACYLIKIIPKLSQILTDNSKVLDSTWNQNCLNALQRLCYLLCQFVEVISTFSNVSVMLFMDDVQWADEASILVLNRLLMKRLRKFFFLGCCRDDEITDEHPFGKMIENVRGFSIDITIVRLSCMDIGTLNEMVSDLLCLPPRLVRSLADIVHKKTKGNPLFFSQLMVSLNRDGFLRLSLGRRRWVWDEDEIQSIKLPNEVVLCFTKGISKLPMEVQSALRTLSMFGASTKCQYIAALESELNVELIEPLKVAAAEGLVINVKGSFHFCHDRIQEAAYSMIQNQDLRRCHLMYGRCLVKLSINKEDIDMLFTAVNQVNLGGRSAVLDKEEFAVMANYNLVAGKRAMEMSDYTSAYGFLFNGISFLPDNHWTDHYQLSLKLYELASQSALATGNSQALGVFSREVLKSGRCFEDKLDIYFIIISSLAYESKFSEAFEKGRDILLLLGEDISGDPSKEALNQHVQHTQSLLRGVSEDDILNYRLMSDNKKLEAMKFLAKMQTITVMVKPSLHPFLTLKMVQLTILHGLSPLSPIGFAFFGSLLAKLGNIQLGYKFILMAKRLLYSEGESAAITTGDVQSACLNRLLYCLTLLWAGVNLSAVHEAMTKASRFIKEQGHQASLFIILIGQRTVLTLMGNQSVSLTPDELSTSVEEKPNSHQLMILSFHNLCRSFMLNNDSAIKEYAEEFFELDKSTWCLFSGSIVQTFIAGLAAFQLYRETQNSLWAERASNRKIEMKLWADQGSSWNFKQKLLLMDAEDHYCKGNYECAKKFYSDAIEYAQLHKFIIDEALACELAAKFYLHVGDLMASMEHFRLAHVKYINWGALAKAERLFAYTTEKFATLFDRHTSLPIDSNTVDFQHIDETDPCKRRAL
ncbi:hypothetical protein HJC23_004451 [Cyclotella cryptica]|uniref:Orc1-like AAA ATPase domain-containing protein n=1 Tax=Cyclotella cryptica TaxID=29204 RepID=A0ABD3QEV8_9STRA